MFLFPENSIFEICFTINLDYALVKNIYYSAYIELNHFILLLSSFFSRSMKIFYFLRSRIVTYL